MKSGISMCCLWSGSSLSAFAFHHRKCWVIMIVPLVIIKLSEEDGSTRLCFWWVSIEAFDDQYQQKMWRISRPCFDVLPFCYCYSESKDMSSSFHTSSFLEFLSLAKWNHFTLFSPFSHQILSGSNMSPEHKDSCVFYYCINT